MYTLSILSDNVNRNAMITIKYIHTIRRWGAHCSLVEIWWRSGAAQFSRMCVACGLPHLLAQTIRSPQICHCCTCKGSHSTQSIMIIELSTRKSLLLIALNSFCSRAIIYGAKAIEWDAGLGLRCFKTTLRSQHPKLTSASLPTQPWCYIQH